MSFQPRRLSTDRFRSPRAQVLFATLSAILLVFWSLASPSTPSASAAANCRNNLYGGTAGTGAPTITRFAQNDGQWCTHFLGYNTSQPNTIGNIGCYITALSMLFNYLQPGSYNPDTVNNSLKANSGFVSGGFLVWGNPLNKVAPRGLTFDYSATDWNRADQELAAGHFVPSRVHSVPPTTSGTAGHMILLIAKSGSTYTMVDSWNGAYYTGTRDRMYGALSNGSPYIWGSVDGAAHIFFRNWPSQAQPPSAPRLSTTPQSSSQVTLAWTATATTISGFQIYREAYIGGAWINAMWVARALPPSTRTYLDSGLAASTWYAYQVQVYNSAGNAWSDWSYAQTNAASNCIAESPHPYANNYNNIWTLTNSDPNAHGTRVHFSRIETEYGYDKIYVRDATLFPIQSLTGSYPSGGWSAVVAGRTVKIQLVTDYSVTAWGFCIDRVETGIPLTSAAAAGTGGDYATLPVAPPDVALPPKQAEPGQ